MDYPLQLVWSGRSGETRAVVRFLARVIVGATIELQDVQSLLLRYR